MGIDLSRMAAAALDTALDDGTRPPAPQRRGGLRTVVAGAALAATARVLVTRRPSLTGLAHLPAALDELRDAPERLRERLVDAGWLDDDEDGPLDNDEQDVDAEADLGDEDLEDETEDDEDLDEE